MSELSILVPARGRPHRVKPLLHSIWTATPDAQVLFLCDPDDEEEIVTVLNHPRADIITCGGKYAAKINLGVRLTDRPLLFFGADDLKFHPGWYEAAKEKLNVGIGVVGVNDLCSKRVQAGVHATHFLVTREYAEEPLIDGEPGPLCEEYEHSCTDDEFWATAQHRNVLAVAQDAIVEHLHPDVGKAEWDDIYAKGRKGIRKDRRLLYNRRSLWRWK